MRSSCSTGTLKAARLQNLERTKSSWGIMPAGVVFLPCRKLNLYMLNTSYMDGDKEQINAHVHTNMGTEMKAKSRVKEST